METPDWDAFNAETKKLEAHIRLISLGAGLNARSVEDEALRIVGKEHPDLKPGSAEHHLRMADAINGMADAIRKGAPETQPQAMSRPDA